MYMYIYNSYTTRPRDLWDLSLGITILEHSKDVKDIKIRSHFHNCSFFSQGCTMRWITVGLNLKSNYYQL